MAEKPTAGMVLSLLGGIFVILVGLAITIVGSILSVFGAGNFLTNFGLLGVVWRLVMMGLGIMMYAMPEQHQLWGVVIASVLSWIGALGGGFIGFLLGLIGGILGITWKPSMVMTAPPPQQTTM